MSPQTSSPQKGTPQIETQNIFHDLLSMQNANVLVLGDIILDSYIRGSVSRISPEAPVPVFLRDAHSNTLGGAGNVAANITALGARAVLCGRVGVDREGDDVLAICQDRGIDTRGLIHCRTTPTTHKARLLAGYQQIVRMDREAKDELTAEQEQFVLDFVREFLRARETRAVVLSDYGKGVLTPTVAQEVLSLCRDAQVPTVTDPKFPDPSRYAFSSVIKPNLKEGRALHRKFFPQQTFLSADDEVDAICRLYLEISGARNIVLSLSEQGVAAFGADVDGTARMKAHALQVADVSGAGDTMVAFVSMGLASGLSLERAVELGNIAAGVVCGKLGTATVSLPEFLEFFRSALLARPPEKIVFRSDVTRLVEQVRAGNKRVVFTNGCFDILHAGHVSYLQQAAAMGDMLVVGLNSDASVKRLKGESRPVQPEEDRAMILSALECVDAVIVFEEDTPLEIIKAVRPDVLVKGADYAPETIVGAPEVLSWGGRVATLPLLDGRSTTRILEARKT